MDKFYHFLAGLITSLVVIAAVGALLYYGAPKAAGHLLDSEKARDVVAVQGGALNTDLADANASQRSCSAEIAASAQAGAAIARLSQMQKPVPGKPEALITDDDINQVIK